MAIADAAGRCRGVEPASNVSKMIMRPPQHGQGWIGLSVASVPAVASCCFAGGGGCGGAVSAISWRARAIVSGLGSAAGEQAVVPDAMEPLRQDVQYEAPDELG